MPETSPRTQSKRWKRVALIHDWLVGMRGGEKVLEQFCGLFPDADIYTLVCDRESISPMLASHQIIESPIARFPWGRSHFRSYLPFFPWAIEALDLRGYDLVISSSHCVAKGAIPPPDALNLSYVHTPMRYVWDVRSDYLGPEQLGYLMRGLAGLGAHYLRNWDTTSAARVDKFIANSDHVRKRINKFYRRDAEVVYPPVEIQRFRIGSGNGGYFLTVSALVPYKRVDLAILACNHSGAKLKVVGDGPEEGYLRSIAGPTIEFTGPVDGQQLVELYQDALALIHPGEEDFGIAPLEAQACGRPVIAFGRGGTLETVISNIPNATGMHFYDQTSESLAGILRSFDPAKFDPNNARANAERFSPQVFISRFEAILNRTWDDFQRGMRIE